MGQKTITPSPHPLAAQERESGDRYNPSTSSGQALPGGRTYQSPFSQRGLEARVPLLALSAVLLTVIQEPFGVAWLAWVAWVPFMLACGEGMTTRRLLICAYLVGLCYWVGNMYWLHIVTLPGYITFGFAQAFYWPVLAYSVRFVRRKRWPLFVFAPVLFVGAEAVQGYLYTGFCWYYLAHSQYANLPLIQISDIFGALGVSVLIAMVNGVIGDWIWYIGWKQKRGIASSPIPPPPFGVLPLDRGRAFFGRFAPPRFCLLATAAIVILLAASCWYGHFRLAETPRYLTEGPLVGSVQPNVPSNVKEEIENAQKILDNMIADSNQCIQAGAGLVLWPETMVLAPMNPDYLARFDQSVLPDIQPQRFHKQILAQCTDKAYVLFGASAVKIRCDNGRCDIENLYNSAFLYRPDGHAEPKRYDKIHLVPFGEYIPFKKTIPWIYKMILFLSPYDYDYNLTAGTAHTTFEVKINETLWRFGVLICYEDTDPTVTRKHVLDESGNKKADWLVNISNDGWYVRFKDNRVLPMAELTQRTAIGVFRCVENRISIVRSVNTGISCLIEPTGRIRNNYQAGNLPKQAMARQGVEGWFVDTIPIDSRVTVFGRYGRWLDIVLAVLFILIFGLAVYDSWKHVARPSWP